MSSKPKSVKSESTKASKASRGKAASGNVSGDSSSGQKKTDEGEIAVYASDAPGVLGAKGKGRSGGGRTSLVGAAPPETSKIELSPIARDLALEARGAEVLRLAEEAFSKTGSWVQFYRAMMGPEGVVAQLYPDPEQRRYFETTPEFAELLEILTSIRSQDDSKIKAYEPERMVTVRLPRSMHESLVEEAKSLDLSINSLCLTKLLQPAGSRFTPLESGPRRGRRPGPQLTLDRVRIKKR